MSDHERALTPETLAELEQLRADATPGPWEVQAGAFGDPSNGPDHMRVLREGWSSAYDADHTVARLGYDSQGGADAALIAAAVNHLPALITAARMTVDHPLAGLYGERKQMRAERDAALAEVAALRERITGAARPLLAIVDDIYEDCTPSRGCSGCEVRLHADRRRAALDVDTAALDAAPADRDDDGAEGGGVE